MRRLVLGIAVAVTSLIPVMGMADDQQIADFIKSRLQVEQQQGNLRGFNVDMRVESGTVWFKGHVSSPNQEMMILRLAQSAGHLGVVQVVDDIEVKSPPAPAETSPYQRVGFQQQQGPLPEQRPMAQQQQMPAAWPRQQPPSPYRQASSQNYVGGAIEGIDSAGEPLPFASCNTCSDGSCGGGSYGAPAPVPTSYGSSAGGSSGSANLPGYAWPSYAAHPNYGALAYPKQHSASAWPYIGPFYPYPQVPLGWRKVSLEWDDGWWMLDFHDK